MLSHYVILGYPHKLKIVYQKWILNSIKMIWFSPLTLMWLFISINFLRLEKEKKRILKIYCGRIYYNMCFQRTNVNRSFLIFFNSLILLHWLKPELWLAFSPISQQLKLVCQNPSHKTATDIICFKKLFTTGSINSSVYTTSFKFQSNSTPLSTSVFPNPLWYSFPSPLWYSSLFGKMLEWQIF